MMMVAQLRVAGEEYVDLEILMKIFPYLYLNMRAHIEKIIPSTFM